MRGCLSFLFSFVCLVVSRKSMVYLYCFGVCGVSGIDIGLWALALVREAFDERSRFGRISWYQFDRELTCLAGFAFFSRFVSFRFTCES